MRILSLALCLSLLPAVAQVPIRGDKAYAEALARGKAENKRVFVYLWTGYSPQCKHVQEQVLPSPEAQAAMKDLVAISVQVHTETKKELPENRLLARRFRLSVYPTFLLLDASGKELKRSEEVIHTGGELAAWVR